VSDPWDPEHRPPPPETDPDWPERDRWQLWDRPDEPETSAETEPWTEPDGDELWSDSVGSRPVSSLPWTGPTWDDQPWGERPPDQPQPDLSAFTDRAEVEEPRAEPEVREPEPRPEVEEPRAEPEVREPEPLPEIEPPAPEPLPEIEEPEPEPPPKVEQPAPPPEVEQREPEPPIQYQPPEREPTSWPHEPAGRFEAAEASAWTAPESAADAGWSVPQPPEPRGAVELAWGEPEPEPTSAESEPEAEPASAEPLPEAERAPGEFEPAIEPAVDERWGAPESVYERVEDRGWIPPEPSQEPPEPAEQAFAAFAPEREVEAPPPLPEPVPQAVAAAVVEPAEPVQAHEPFEEIDGDAYRGSLDTTSGSVETALGAEDDWDGRSERRQPTTAESVVPWLIGLILLLSGMVIVLLALIFTSDQGLLAGVVSPSPSAIGSNELAASPGPAASPGGLSTASHAPTSKPSATAKPPPTYGALELVYLGRSAPLAHIYLLRHDFTSDVAPVVLARDPAQDVERLAWSPDGTHGAAIIAGRLVAIEQGKSARGLADGIVASTFSADGRTVYALRIVLGNGTDRAEVLQITYATGDAKKLTSWTYPRPVIGAESALKEAQFADDGGSERLFRLNDGSLRVWMLGAPTYRVTTSGSTSKLANATLPVLWATDGMKRIELTESGGTTTLTLRNPDGGTVAATTAKGLVSHLRWSPDDSQVTFTLGRSVGSGVQQDLFLWDLSKSKAPMQLTNTGAAFGAEWLGASESWRP
jgi:hypothetical protein